MSTERMLQIVGVTVAAAGLALVPAFFPSFLVYQFSIALTYAIAILGLNLLMGFNGQISVAQGVFFALGAYATAICATRYGMSYIATLPFAVGIAALVGLLVGIPALRMQGLPLAFVTLGLAVLVPPLALKLDFITNGASGISFAKPEPPPWFPGNQDTFLFEVCLLGMGLCVLIAQRLLRGDTGRALRAVRDNGLIAESLGVNLTAVRLAAFTTSAAYAGFGGWFFALVNGYVSPESFQMTMSFYFLAGAIVGGITSIGGAFIGALFITFVPDFSADINLALSGVIYGGALVAMMLVARDGVVGVLRAAYAQLRRKFFAQVEDDRLLPIKEGFRTRSLDRPVET
jgi:branched-chain amino acid transport system permease protein